MPPKKVYVQPASSRRQPKGFFRSTYDSLTSPENSSMVKAIASFGVGVTFLASSWGEFLLPPMHNKENRDDCTLRDETGTSGWMTWKWKASVKLGVDARLSLATAHG
ncbi:hypothetical protein J7T55_009393 [Diaporthe amygdali]|uniref:uncharacterized protein n=1 Tax=Phomopsis amygdali TaxID=1214568 RepID=UPI0022FE6D41|nr:uncharacterized protein J7T55_009393 [Diaporthe amygdali]KAJ0107428.1 hypothetical protein J7T55_009393 [Diaporthe amygdali]